MVIFYGSLCQPDEVLVERVGHRNVRVTQRLQDPDPEVRPSLHGLLVSSFLLSYCVPTFRSINFFILNAQCVLCGIFPFFCKYLHCKKDR